MHRGPQTGDRTTRGPSAPIRERLPVRLGDRRGFDDEGSPPLRATRLKDCRFFVTGVAVGDRGRIRRGDTPNGRLHADGDGGIGDPLIATFPSYLSNRADIARDFLGNRSLAVGRASAGRIDYPRRHPPRMCRARRLRLDLLATQEAVWQAAQDLASRSAGLVRSSPPPSLASCAGRSGQADLREWHNSHCEPAR